MEIIDKDEMWEDESSNSSPCGYLLTEICMKIPGQLAEVEECGTHRLYKLKKYIYGHVKIARKCWRKLWVITKIGRDIKNWITLAFKCFWRSNCDCIGIFWRYYCYERSKSKWQRIFWYRKVFHQACRH